MEATIFSRIANHELPAYIVWEDERFCAFLDILPIEPGHTVVIPKEQFVSLEDMPPELLGDFFVAVQRVSAGVMSALGAKGYSLFLNNKDAANQHIPHVHFHIVPRVDGDGLERWAQSAYEEGEAEMCVEKIKKILTV